nr:CDP-alcohol phosphatidyltransferase family protein [Wenzhouxiangella sp. XN79A]
MPNVLTGLRLLLVPPILVLLVQGIYGWALALAIVAGVSDALDGWLARRFGWQTRIGGILDPLADKLLLVGTYLTLGALGHLPAWLVALVVLRDVVIVAGAMVYHFRFEVVQPEPTQLSKVNTVAQLLLMMVVLVELAGAPVPSLIEAGLVRVVGALVVLTLAQYVWIWSQRASRIARERSGR